MKIENWKNQSHYRSLAIILALVITPNLSAEQVLLSTEQPKQAPIVQSNIAQSNIEQPTNLWRFLHDYQARYAVQSEGTTLGHATRALKFDDQKWTLSTSAKISKFFISVKTRETSTFHIKDNELVNDHFYSRTKISLKKARVMEQIFDWDNKIETGYGRKKSWEIPLDKQVFDRVSNVIQLRADLLAGKTDFNYDVSYKGKAFVYSYNLVKTETLKTKIGDISTIKFLREKANGDQVVLWLAPEYNYIPFKIAQYEKGEADVTLFLESIEYLPVSVSTEETNKPVKAH